MTATTIIIILLVLFFIQQIISGIFLGITDLEIDDRVTLSERKKNLIDKWHNHPNLKRRYTTIDWRIDPINKQDGQTKSGNEYYRPIPRSK